MCGSCQHFGNVIHFWMLILARNNERNKNNEREIKREREESVRWQCQTELSNENILITLYGCWEKLFNSTHVYSSFECQNRNHDYEIKRNRPISSFIMWWLKLFILRFANNSNDHKIKPETDLTYHGLYFSVNVRLSHVSVFKSENFKLILCVNSFPLKFRLCWDGDNDDDGNAIECEKRFSISIVWWAFQRQQIEQRQQMGIYFHFKIGFVSEMISSFRQFHRKSGENLSENFVCIMCVWLCTVKHNFWKWVFQSLFRVNNFKLIWWWWHLAVVRLWERRCPPFSHFVSVTRPQQKY